MQGPRHAVYVLGTPASREHLLSSWRDRDFYLVADSKSFFTALLVEPSGRFGPKTLIIRLRQLAKSVRGDLKSLRKVFGQFHFLVLVLGWLFQEEGSHRVVGGRSVIDLERGHAS